MLPLIAINHGYRNRFRNGSGGDCTIMQHETRHSDGGAFYRVSFDGSACGSGSYDNPTYSYSESESRCDWDYGYCGYCGSYGYKYDYTESCCTGDRHVTYDYSADWCWNMDGTWSANVTNSVTGNADWTNVKSWDHECEYNYDYYAGCCCYYYYSDIDGSTTHCTTLDYDDIVTNTSKGCGFTSGSYVRWSPFSGSTSEGQYDYTGCCGYVCCYEYHNAYFSAPNFSVSMFDCTYDYGSGPTSYESVNVNHPGTTSYGFGSFVYGMPTSHIPNGNVPANAKPPENRKLGTAEIIVAQPNFDNYHWVDMDVELNKCNVGLAMFSFPPERDDPTFDVDNVPGVSSSQVSIVGAFFGGLWSGMHNALDIAGLIPGVGEVADGANALIYAAEGDTLSAGLSAAAMIPIVGWGATGGRALKRGAATVAEAGLEQGIKHADDAAKAGKTVVKTEAKAAEEVAQGAAKNAPKKSLKERMIQSGNPPPKDMPHPQAHHDLPQKFEKDFNAAGLDIHDPQYGRWVNGGPEGNHQKWSKAFNDEWEKFLRANPNASKEEILDKMNELRSQFQ